MIFDFVITKLFATDPLSHFCWRRRKSLSKLKKIFWVISRSSKECTKMSGIFTRPDFRQTHQSREKNEMTSLQRENLGRINIIINERKAREVVLRRIPR